MSSEWFDTYQALIRIDGYSQNDEYFPPERDENDFVRRIRMKSDSDLHSIIGKFLNEQGELPKVNLKNAYANARFNNLLKVWRPDYEPPDDDNGQANLF